MNVNGENNEEITQYTHLETFRSFLLLGGSDVRKAIRMGPDPLQWLDHTIKGKQCGCVPQGLLLVS